MSEKLKDANFDTGAVRSADVDHLDFCSMPLMGLLGVIAIAGKGGIKYGRYNYAKGMPVHATLNHVVIHLIKYVLGDRSEDHLSKVAWGAMVANETAAKNPELAEPYLLGPGASLTEALLAEMERGKPERDRARQAGEFEDLFKGTFADMPEVKALVAEGRCQRNRRLNKKLAKLIKQNGAVGPLFVAPTTTKYVSYEELGGITTQSVSPSKPADPRTESHVPVTPHKATGNPEPWSDMPAANRKGLDDRQPWTGSPEEARRAAEARAEHLNAAWPDSDTTI